MSTMNRNKAVKGLEREEGYYLIWKDYRKNLEV